MLLVRTFAVTRSLLNRCSTTRWKQTKVRYDKGTSTFKYKGGVAVAAELRATGGEYIGCHDLWLGQAACSPLALGRHTQFGVLDNGYKFDMDDQEALELAHKAIHHAIFRDLASGGIVREVLKSLTASLKPVINMTDEFISNKKTPEKDESTSRKEMCPGGRLLEGKVTHV
ncbi:uncharacterized protein LOC115322303 isoform X2 [Ixodes scapularis]|uniref:uncharacterized protein LOC115322303 isoform X2 n=1 Tax=Ixodes scapularis TaxID=6945 RepID=UPI001A9E2D6D|nr:uncharacterized protein LOC115322303 isoform X2 [Ixodes scapularis]